MKAETLVQTWICGFVDILNIPVAVFKTPAHIQPSRRQHMAFEELQTSGYATKLQLRTLARNYLLAGGPVQAWHEAMNEAAAEMPGEGQEECVQSDRLKSASARLPVASEEAIVPAPERAIVDLPPARAERSADQHIRASDGQHGCVGGSPQGVTEGHGSSGLSTQRASAPIAPPVASGEASGRLPEPAMPLVPPAREPSASRISAMIAVNQAAARSVLYTYKTSDGTPWADIHPYEVMAMSRDAIRGKALLAACAPLNAKQMRMTFAQLLTPERAKIAFDTAQKELAHVA